MSTPQTPERQDGTRSDKKRAPYEAPRLVHFGLVRDLTAEGSGRHPENPGSDETNNKRRFP